MAKTAEAAQSAKIGAALLGWYDTNARRMPWRVAPEDRKKGILPDPYRVWLSEVMLQQTTVAAVTGYFNRFTTRWPTIEDLAFARDEDVMGEWAGLGYYARARNLLKCARAVVSNNDGAFPSALDTLLCLPGIGPYTAAAIASIAFDQRATVVDGNVERVISRLYAIETPLPAAKPMLTQLAAALTPADRPGDHAQAMMDLGATVCTPKSPTCKHCPLSGFCAGHALGIAASLPRKLPKVPKPIRHGVAYVALRDDGALLLERRPNHGLLGGMLGFPGSEWGAAVPDDAPPVAANWQLLSAQVTHTFTHFHLILQVMVARVPTGTNPQRGDFIHAASFRAADLPSVMRKVHDAAAAILQPVERASG